MDEQRELLELLKRLRGVRFSLATCALLVLFIGAVIAAWANRHPWMMVQSTPFQSNKVATYSLLSDEGKILVHRPHTETPLAIWDWHTGELQTVEFPPNEMLLESTAGGRLLTADKKGTARVRQLGLKFPLAERTNWVHPTAVNLRISADGNRIAGSGPDGAVWIYDLDSQEETIIPAKTKSLDRVYLEFSEDGRWLQAAEIKRLQDWADRGDCLAWQLIDCNSGARVEVPTKVEENARKYAPYSCSFAGTNDRIFMGDRHWQLGSRNPSANPEKPAVYLGKPQRSLIALLVNKAILTVYTNDLSQRIGSVTLDRAVPLTDVSLSPSGDLLTVPVVIDSQRREELWNTATGKRIHVFDRPFTILRFLSENHILVRDHQKGQLQVWWRRRPEAAWGMLGLPEVWLALAFLGGTIFSILRDHRIAKAKNAAPQEQ